MLFEFFSCSRMDRDQNRFSKFFRDLAQPYKYSPDPLRYIDILRAVKRYQKILKRRDAKGFHHFAGFYFVSECIQDLLDRVSRHENTIAFNALANQIFLASLGIWHQNGAGMVDYTAVDFLRDAVVVAPVSGFHVKHGNLSPRR